MVNNVLNAEEKDDKLLQEFISQVTSENSKLKYNVFEMPQQKDANSSITEDKE